jgi:tagaturonate reductase
MILSKNNIESIPSDVVDSMPDKKLFMLPEKVLQFGTGVLLRGLPDYFIDKANKTGIFNGRILIIKSTSTGGVDAFDEQDGLYTICIRGIDGENKIEENIINASISRVLSAKHEWTEILKSAANPDMQIVISNTTEVGITLVQDSIHASPPESYPGKLLAFLHARYKFFHGDKDKGMVIVPTELIIDNGDKLKSILLELSHQNKLESSFIDWLLNSNYFCNSLVDRIVPGKLSPAQHEEMEKGLGYEDQLMIVSEVYRLWAIESNESKVREILSFNGSDDGVVIAEDINIFRELKLRLLNGSHTFSCGLAHLCGFNTVKEAMDNKIFAGYLTNLMMQEIAPAIALNQISLETARDFANKVIDRYRNPHIEHQWLSIGVQYSSKMRMRNVPTIKNYYEQFGKVPEYMALGFAAFLLFMKAEKNNDGQFVGNVNNKNYLITDDNISSITEKWHHSDTAGFVTDILSEKNLWETDLSRLPGFVESVTAMIYAIEKSGTLATLKKFVVPKTIREA